ncbi:MAG: protein translocase SEC61 complex subunit gamma [Promethearchaeota archaeon]
MPSKKKNSNAPKRSRLGTFWLNTKRIAKIAKKPDKKEYFLVLKICAVGLAILGGLSFVIQLISAILTQNMGS